VLVEWGCLLNNFVHVWLRWDGVCLCIGRGFVLAVFVLCVCLS